MIVGSNIYKIGQRVQPDPERFLGLSMSGHIIDVRTKSRRGARGIQYKVKFPGLENRMRKRAEWWFYERDLVPVVEHSKFRRFMEWMFNVIGIK